MNKIDKLKLLRGSPILMSDESFFVYPKTLGDIEFLGSEKFFKYINLLTITKEEIFAMVGIDLTPFQFFMLNCMQEGGFKKTFIEALYYFIQEEILISCEISTIVVGDIQNPRLLVEDNFSEFQHILSVQNCLDKSTPPVKEDDAAKAIKKKLAIANKKINKQKNNDNIEFSDLISSLCVNSNINILDVWNLSYYAFNDQFKRMKAFENYKEGLQSIMAGADPKKINLKDWITDIQ